MTEPVTSKKSRSSKLLLLEIWKHLSTARRIQLLVLFLVMCQVESLSWFLWALFCHFLLFLRSPAVMGATPSAGPLRKDGLSKAANNLLLPATLLFVFAAVLAGLVRLANLWLNGRLAASIGSDLSCSMFHRLLYQPYEFHVRRNSSEVIASITNYIPRLWFPSMLFCRCLLRPWFP